MTNPQTDRQMIETIIKRRGIATGPFVGHDEPNEITIRAHDRTGIQAGYSGFYISMRFDDDGTLTQIGAWE